MNLYKGRMGTENEFLDLSFYYNNIFCTPLCEKQKDGKGTRDIREHQLTSET